MQQSLSEDVVEEFPLDIPASIARMGEPDFWREIMDAFFEETPQYLQQLRTALADADEELLTRSAHSIKGCSAEILAEPLRRISETVERLSRAGERQSIPELLPRLEAEYERLELFVRASGFYRGS
jgi:HPt (histidine-containing phosphotransfer) domain-containing protein